MTVGIRDGRREILDGFVEGLSDKDATIFPQFVALASLHDDTRMRNDVAANFIVYTWNFLFIYLDGRTPEV